MPAQLPEKGAGGIAAGMVSKMKKRILAIALIAAMLIPMLQIPALAAEHPYSSIPIYIGYADVDYMADQILAEIPLTGKNARGQIQAVYDWIILYCQRDSWDGTYYFDAEDVYRHTDAYIEQANALLQAGDAVIRPEWTAYFGINSLDESYDSNYYVATFAYEMMMTRTGNCAHFSALLAVLLGHLGFDCRLIPGEFINGDGSQVEHKWNYVLVDGQYYWLDVRMDHATYTSTGSVPHDYFLVSSKSAWACNHSWDAEYSDLLAENASDIVAMYEEHTHIHTLEAVPNKQASCTEDGQEAHWVCAQCGRYFLDAAGTQEVSQKDLIIPAQGHAWGEWTVTKQNTHSEYGIRQRVCQNDPSHVETEKIPASGNPFDDVPAGEYYETPVVWAVDRGITNGTGGAGFSPNADCTRGQVVTFLWRAAGEPEPTATVNPFVDVASDQYYYKAVLWAVENGITNGTSSTTFSPNDTCTRAQVVTFLWRAEGEPDVSAENPFADVDADAYYAKAVQWAIKSEVTRGTSDTTFSPEDSCTRGQVVTFLYRAKPTD